MDDRRRGRQHAIQLRWANPADDLHSQDAAPRRRHQLLRAHPPGSACARDRHTSVVRAMEPEAPVSIRTLDEVVGRTIARPRAISVLVGAFALVALVLAAVGVYGVIADSVKERTREIGVRMALGASSASVFRMVLGQALRLVLIGIATGLLASAPLTRLLAGLLFDVEPLDPTTFATTSLALLTIATVAAYIPGRRSMRMAPVDALRRD